VEDRTIVICEATTADIPVLLELVHTAFAEYEGRLDPPSGAHKETDASLRLALQTGSVALAFVDGEAAGCVFYSPEEGYLYIGRLSVRPALRRFGIGTALMKYAERRARELGFQRTQIGVRIALVRLHAYYERLGYRVVRYEAHPGYAAPTSIVMEKEIS
jgi:predicted N-acetyltransferase YhbS